MSRVKTAEPSGATVICVFPPEPVACGLGIFDGELVEHSRRRSQFVNPEDH
jgi:hypothetical protein